MTKEELMTKGAERRFCRLEDRRLELAIREEVLNFLAEIAQPVINLEQQRQILIKNLLERGSARPEVGERLIQAIKTPNGWKQVNDNGWVEAAKMYLDSLGNDYDSILHDEGVKTECSLKERGQRPWSRHRQEIYFDTNIPGVQLLRVEEYEDGLIKKLGIDIFNPAVQSDH